MAPRDRGPEAGVHRPEGHDERPHPPGSYDVVVVGSGPGGLQTSYSLARLGVRHAVISRDPAPAGMFRRYPIFERLISWTKPDAPFERGTREYEWYDHNSLVADEEESRATVPEFMDRSFDVPSRGEMEAALVAASLPAGAVRPLAAPHALPAAGRRAGPGRLRLARRRRVDRAHRPARW